MYGSLGKGVSVTEQMASAIQETEPERFERLKQRIHNVTESIGNSLLPTVNDLMSKGEGVLTKVGSWIEKNQELVKVIMLIVLAVGGFLAVGGTLIALISGVGLVVTKTVSAFKILKGGFALARGALTPLISSVWSFTAALLANPVTWVVIGIVALIAALVLLYNKCEWFRNAVNSVINFFKETLTAVGSVAKSVFEGIGNVIGSVMDAAKATVSEKLSNIKTAYEEHGGGISGVAAAAMEAVKGWYTAGYTFIDNLTGGKLSEIRGKFSTAMSNIVQGISQKFTDARTAFSNGLNNIKNAVSGAVTWFFESGKRIVSTFANGIKSAFSSAVEAVKGGLQKIRNLLPFSDAKEGPLSTLTLSGQRTMTTYAHGLTLAGDAPAEAMNKSLQQVQGALDRKPEKKVDLGGGKKDKDESSDTEDDESARARTLRSWSELAQRATEDTFIDAAESVPGVLFAQADCNHPRGQGTVDVIVTGTAGEATEGLLAAVREAVDKIAGPYDNILVKSSVTVSQNISVTVTTDTADTDEAVENRVKAILTELLAVRRSRKLNELTLSDINHAIRSGYSGATNAAVSEPEADVKLGKDKVITLGDVSVTVERE